MKHQCQVVAVVLGWCCLIMLGLIILLTSCTPYVKPIPTNKELFKKYSFQEADLEKVTFYFSNRLTLKTDLATFKYQRKGDMLELNDDREDRVYSVSIEEKGRYVEKGQKAAGYTLTPKIPFFKKVNYELINVRFEVDGLGQVDFEFVENHDGFFQLAKNEKGKVVAGGKTFVCVDGCNSLLMIKARENDRYRLIDQPAPNGCFFGKTLLGFLALFAALYLFSR